jgi:hypothetical protein
VEGGDPADVRVAVALYGLVGVLLCVGRWSTGFTGHGLRAG